MSPESINIYEAPHVYFKYAAREAKARAKLCEMYSSYFDDLAFAEDVFGKNVLKSGSSNRSQSKDQWPVETNNAWDQLYTTSERLGKQHIGFSLCISQSIARELYDHGRSSSRRVQEIETKLQSLLDDISKSTRSIKKKNAKYARLVQDAEAAIIARDGAIRDYAEKINDQTGEGFINRSLTKVLGKFAPTDALRKQHDRCRNLIHELDAVEKNLAESTNNLMQQHENFHIQLGDALREVNRIEMGRLQFLKDGLLRFCQAISGMNDHVSQILDSLQTLVNSLDIQSDVEAFERELEAAKLYLRDDPSTSGTPVTSESMSFSPSSSPVSDGRHMPSTSPPESTGQYWSQHRTSDIEEESSRHLRSNMLVLDRLKYALECLKRSTQRATSAFADMGDLEKAYGKMVVKVLEKHGYTSSSSLQASNHSSNMMMMSSGFAPNEAKCADFAHSYESALVRNGWTGVVKTTELLAESHFTTAQVLFDKCGVMNDSAQRRMEATIRDVTEKLISVTKKMDGAKAAHTRASGKLSRVRKELRDRRLAMSHASSGSTSRRMSNRDDGDTVSAAAAATASTDSEALEKYTVAGPDEGRGHLNDAGLDVQTSQNDKRKLEWGEKTGVIQGLESIGTAFGAVGAALGVTAGVLESSAERNIQRIANLEEEEKACIESLQSARSSVQIVTDSCVNELSIIIVSLKQGISQEMEAMKSSFRFFLDGNAVGLSMAAGAVDRLKGVAEVIEVDTDMKQFHSHIVSAALASEDRKVVNPMVLPPVEAFSPIQNELVDLERSNEKESTVNEELGGQDVSVMTSPSLYGAALAVNARGRGLLRGVKPRRSKSAENLSSQDDDVPTRNRKLSGVAASFEQERIGGRHSEGSIGTVPPPIISQYDSFSMGDKDVLDDKTCASLTVEDVPGGSTEVAQVDYRDDATDGSVSISQDTSKGLVLQNDEEVMREPTELTSHSTVPASSIEGVDIRTDSPSSAFLSRKSPQDLPSLPEALSVVPTEDPGEPQDFSSEISDVVTPTSAGKRIYDSPTTVPVTVINTSTDSLLSPPANFKTTSRGEITPPRAATLRGNPSSVIHSSIHDPVYDTDDVSPQSSVDKVSALKRNDTSNTPNSAIPYRPTTISPVSENLIAPELVKFELPPTEKILEYFSCALYPKRGLLTHGRLFITNHYVAFSGWPELRVLISLKRIDNVEKKQIFFLPNALTIKEIDGEEYFFGSFLDRDLCFRMITSLVMIEKSLDELTESDHGRLSGPYAPPPTRESAGRDDVESSTAGGNVLDRGASVLLTEDDDSECDEDDSDVPNFLALLSKSGISIVYEGEVDVKASMIWNHCWKGKGHFSDFLISEGDFDIKSTDWTDFNSSLTSAQDPAGLDYRYTRSVDYLHPRTSMLMFGPKNATAKQSQYLCVVPAEKENQGKGCLDTQTLQSVKAGAILTATQFEGIPMCDVFEVLQYWTFQRISGPGNKGRSIIRVGVSVNFLKSTLLKGQIFTGVKEELTVLSKNWVDFSIASIKGRTSSGAISEHSQTALESTSRSRTSSSASASIRRGSIEGHDLTVSTTEVCSSSTIHSTQKCAPTTSRESSSSYNDRVIIFSLIVSFMIFQIIFLFVIYSQLNRSNQQMTELLKLLAEKKSEL